MQKIKYYAIWSPIVCAIAGYLYNHYLGSDEYIAKSILIGFVIGLVLELYIWSVNQMKIKNGKPMDKLGWLDAFDLHDRYMVDSGKYSAMHPEVCQELLYEEPTGFVLGKYNGRYVCITPEQGGNGNVLINGGSGTGKTSAAGIIASALIANNPEKEDTKVRQFIYDPKSELRYITGFPNDGAYCIEPANRENSYGYDALYLLNDNSTEQQVYETASVIAVSVIPQEKGETDPIWRNSSRAMLMSFIIYGWTKKRFTNLAEIFSWCLSATAKELVAEVVEHSSPNSIAYKLVIAFYGDASPDDFVGSVYGTLTQKIQILVADKDLEYCIGYNPRKYNPSKLLKGSCYMNIPPNKAVQYSVLSSLIINQQINWVLGLVDYINEPDRPRIQLIIDEASALLQSNRIDRLCDLLRLERSKGCQSILAIQSFSGLLCSYSQSEAEDIISNCSAKLFLDATTPETQELITKLVGKYQMRTSSVSGYGANRKQTISYQDEDIITTADMATLGSSKEMILVSGVGGFSMIQKAPWYKDNKLKAIATEIKQLNEEE